VARVLIVEDEAIPRTVLQKMLVRDGHEVASAATAEEAIQLAGTVHPEVLIADWLLPEGNSGLHVAERLRAQDSNLRILFFTGLPTYTIEREASHLRPFRFLEKPCDFETLRKAIQELSAEGRQAS